NRMIAADGRVVWLSDFVHVVTDDDGVVRRLYGVMVEITESKRAAEATRTLAEVSRLLARSLDRDALAHRIADGVRQLFDATVAARAGRVFGAREIRLAEAFADQAAVALAGARLHEEASHADDFLRSVVANRADTVLTTDVHGRITYFSALAEKVCGWEAKELL